ncbi:MaoC/PaaZ C-terminal domain-containing protein [Virgibacillus xinjiangensis]|uniref:MaoC/PaaZ C-terminal domain-containing protein n=1 Tax=Virgibacillus xinjiangensis TaxID=393090 RepID=A0ABV7CUV6_9BACI
MIGRRKLGKQIGDLKVGDSFEASKRMDDRDLLLYLGLTNDSNPLYTQHDYASQTPYEKPVVPSVMLFGMVSSLVSMHLPGPGSHITQHEMTFPTPVFHETEVKFLLEVIALDIEENRAALAVTGYNEEGNTVIQGKLYVTPAYQPNSLTASSLENFF